MGQGGLETRPYENLRSRLAALAGDPPFHPAHRTGRLFEIALPQRLDLHSARGQYAAGWQGGQWVGAYLDEDGIVGQ